MLMAITVCTISEFYEVVTGGAVLVFQSQSEGLGQGTVTQFALPLQACFCLFLYQVPENQVSKFSCFPFMLFKPSILGCLQIFHFKG